ncbi:MAG TPA: stage III sporulation protein AG [Clostridiales bacterium]|nr:stage III sporulation protein AG [Clostridiales bacterium]
MELVRKICDGVKNIIAGQDKKKIIENSIIIIIIGIIFLIAGSTLFKSKNTNIIGNTGQGNFQKSSMESVNNSEEGILTSKSGGVYSIEKEVEEILSQIEGAGKVSVAITYESGSEKVPAYDKRESHNSTQEEDDRGGKRNISQNESDSRVAYEEQPGGVKRPIILKEMEPKVRGVVVVADGAGEPVVKENLVRAVQTLVDIAPHKVQVFARAKSAKNN